MRAQYLEWREKQYDVRERVDVFSAASSSEPVVRGALVYIASEDRTKNLNYLGTAPREAIAQQIAFAAGPSGPNHEYLSNLAAAMQQVCILSLTSWAMSVHQCHACKTIFCPALGRCCAGCANELFDAVQMGVHDEDLVWLAARVREIRAEAQENRGGGAGAAAEVAHPCRAEEAEKDLHLSTARLGAAAAADADAFVAPELHKPT